MSGSSNNAVTNNGCGVFYSYVDGIPGTQIILNCHVTRHRNVCCFIATTRRKYISNDIDH